VSAAGIETIPLAGANLAEAVARHLVVHHARSLPDLSGLIVLVPNHRAGQDLMRALARQAKLPALIPPKITPLRAWAAHHATTAPEPQARRLARLHGVLRTQKWLGEVDRWSLARELLQLADELSAARMQAEAGERIRALNGKALEQETALIEAVWHAMNRSGSDPQACYAKSLQAIPPGQPLYGYALGPLTGLEKSFLGYYVQSAPVTLFTQDANERSPVLHILSAAWAADSVPIKARADAVAGIHANSPVRAGLRVGPAPHLEAEARAVATWVAEQLQAGRKHIALIAFDREAARRTRALLERMNVLIADETGWTLSTTAAASVIDRWLTCVAEDFPHTELLDLLKSPFVLGGLAARQDAVLALELAMRNHGVSKGMADIQRLARQEVPGAHSSLESLVAAAREFAQTRAPLAIWLQRLLDSLGRLNAAVALAADAAGVHVINALQRLHRELAGETEKYNFSEWRRWLNLALESESFADEGVASPIVLTSLPNARGRVFEAVALIGADAQHLPVSPSPGLFSQSVRARLGLPTEQDAVSQTTDDLVHLLAQGPSLLSWQAWHNDEPNPPSLYIVRLQALHQAAWHCRLDSQPAGRPPTRQEGLPHSAHQPAPRISSSQLPRRCSATAYQTLIDCPYRFFARYVLGLKELDEADEALDKSDYGSLLHRILKHFHDSPPPQERDAALALLNQVSEGEFAALPAYTAVAWRSRWAAIQGAYVDFWLGQTAAGWQFQSGETRLSTQIDIPALGEVELFGDADRIDIKGNALNVIDYKTSAASSLKKKLKDPAEAVQLPFYAWLADAAAAYLPIDETPIAPLMLDGETDVEAISLRLPQMLGAIAQGAALPAQGVDAVCRYCEARGLCRKGMWHE
jgi:ATP-dependent helicase/nuclease subunit B